ncbi:cysteine synthase family protein [Candidatus Woesearchaeota archaeon]|jgi:cysteine synthase|nr:cysteine synthase family protein [Candidatus Woesearchaeota archaeon]
MTSLIIGNTPLIKVEEIYTKLECTNPCGSIKDRIAKYIIEESEKKGILKSGMTIVEATSGNTGIAFSYFGKEKGYKVTIIMPENMTEERKEIIKKLGANLIECSSEGSFAEAAQIRDNLANNSNYFNPDQFSNPLNVECHEKTTGQEILAQIINYTDKPIDAFVAGVGTGGTLIGVGKALRKINPNVHIVAVEPTESAVMSGGKPGEHGISGIGDGFIPAIASNGEHGMNEMINEVICVSTEEAKDAARHLEETHGFCVGISSGSNFVAAKKLKEKYETVVTVFADGYPRYKSRGLKQSQKGRCPYERSRIDVLLRKDVPDEFKKLMNE